MTAQDDPNNPDSEYKNIFVNLEEDNTGSLLFGVGVNSDAGLTGSIVLNERNFDITRVPTSFDDLLSGNAFRGAGQEFRLEAVPGTQLQRYTATFREPFLFDSPYSLGVSGYYYDRHYNEDTESRLGARFTLGRKLGSVLDGVGQPARRGRGHSTAYRLARRRLHERGRRQLPGRLEARPPPTTTAIRCCGPRKAVCSTSPRRKCTGAYYLPAG